MSTEAKIVFSGNSTGAEAAATKAAAGLKKIETAARSAGAAADNLGAKIQKIKGPTAAEGALRAISRGGGVVGSTAGRVAESIQAGGKFGGGIMALGLAATAASLALHALVAASDRAAEQAGRVAEGMLTLDRARKSAVGAADQAALEKTEILRGLLGIGGQGAVDMATSLEKQGVLGASEGLTTLYRANMASPAAINAARRASQTGQMGFETAAGIITQGTSLTGSVDEDAMRILRNGNIATQHRSISQMVSAAAGASGVLDRIRTGQGETTAAALVRGQNQNLPYSDPLRDAYATVAHPELVARQKVNEALEEQERVLRAQTDAAWLFVEVLKEMGSWVGMSDGSKTMQLKRHVEVRRQVVGGG
jgi:hypothetical protein